MPFSSNKTELEQPLNISYRIIIYFPLIFFTQKNQRKIIYMIDL